jgi:hypothetical protein
MRRGDTHVCLSFKCGVGTVVIKNCDPFVPGPAESQRQRRVRAQGWSHCRDSAVLGNVDSPALAMAKMYGWENRCFGDISSSNSPPQQDSPPVPSPIAWDQHGSWIQYRYFMCPATYQMDHQSAASAIDQSRYSATAHFTCRLASRGRLTNLRMTRWNMRLL